MEPFFEKRGVLENEVEAPPAVKTANAPQTPSPGKAEQSCGDDVLSRMSDAAAASEPEKGR